MLKVEGVNQYYGGSHILRDVSFEAKAGEVTVVLGRNGVGKTTLLKSLMGVVPIRTGTITLDGTPLGKDTPYERGAGGHQALDRLGAAELEGDVECADPLVQPQFGGLARARAVLAQRPGGRAQLAQAQRAADQRVIGGGEHHEFVGQPGAHDEARMRLRALDETDVGVERGHRLDDLARVADHQAHRVCDVRELPLRLQRGQQVLADRQAGGQAQRRAVAAGEEMLEVGGLVEQRRCLGQQRAALLVEHEPPADAVEQARLEVGLELGQRRARRRLRTRDAVGRGTRRPGARSGDEDLELAQAQAQPRTRADSSWLICFSTHSYKYCLLFLLSRHLYDARDHPRNRPAQRPTHVQPSQRSTPSCRCGAHAARSGGGGNAGVA